MTLMKKRFYKYLTIGEEDIKWGLYLTGAGDVKVNKNTEYPLIDDPSHHYFHWSKGRRLSSYQLLYITQGKGVFESELTEMQTITAGDVFLLFPGVWHRFQPDKSTGWSEFWVEFDGAIADHFRKKEFLNPSTPVISIGLQEDIAENFLEITLLVQEEKPGFQYLASGIVIQILGQIFARIKYNPFEGKEIEQKIKEAKLLIMENLNTKISQEEIAESLSLGYSLYRKKFKEYTGISPASYQLQLRINSARHLLITTKKDIKEIAASLGFESVDYFYRYFKQKTGFTPSEYREKDKR